MFHVLPPHEHFRESTLAHTARLSSFQRILEGLDILGQSLVVLSFLVASAAILWQLKQRRYRETCITLLYSVLYFLASPSAILINKILMKDVGFHYPITVSAFGQVTTVIYAVVSVHALNWTKLNNGPEGEVSPSVFRQ